ncbi:MAG: Ig-like domain-containing protein, partial [Deltaproteobacteria bacterium]|nr:Ig-like domain-containing protein [Deltaproteobacteria bacterium]
MRARVLVAALIIALAATFSACTLPGTPDPTQPTLDGIWFANKNPTLAVGSSLQLTGEGHYSDGTSKDLTAQLDWASSDASTATVAGGLVLALKAGPVSIIATDPETGTTNSLSMTIADKPVVLSRLAFTRSTAHLTENTSFQFVATGTFSDGTTKDLTDMLTWTSSDASVATIPGGFAHALKPGTTTVSATDPITSLSASISLSVDATPVTLAGISFDTADAHLPAGTSLQLHALGNYSDGSVKDLTATVQWTSSDSQIATVTAGLIQGAKAGTVTVSALDPATSISSSIQVSVRAAALVSITVSGPSGAIPLGTIQNFSARGSFTDGSSHDVSGQVTWQLSGSALAFTSSGAATGQAKGVQQGQSQLTATDPASGVSGSLTVTVGPAALVSIALTPSNTYVTKGLTLQLKATGTYTDGGTADITGSATWATSDSNAGPVSSGGLVSAQNVGIVTITATKDSITGDTSVTINAAQLA